MRGLMAAALLVTAVGCVPRAGPGGPGVADAPGWEEMPDVRPRPAKIVLNGRVVAVEEDGWEIVSPSGKALAAVVFDAGGVPPRPDDPNAVVWVRGWLARREVRNGTPTLALLDARKIPAP